MRITALARGGLVGETGWSHAWAACLGAALHDAWLLGTFIELRCLACLWILNEQGPLFSRLFKKLIVELAWGKGGGGGEAAAAQCPRIRGDASRDRIAPPVAAVCIGTR